MVAHSYVLWMMPTITSCLFGTGRRKSNWLKSRYPEDPFSIFAFVLQSAFSSWFLSLQCSNDSVLAAVFHPMDDNLIVTCGKSHINFWTIDSNTLIKKQGLFEVTIAASDHTVTVHFGASKLTFGLLSITLVLLSRNTRSQSTCCVWPLLRMEMPSQETPVETSTSGPKVDLKSVR